MGGDNSNTETSLWCAWRDSTKAAGEAAIEPDALKLAAYAENRLGRPDLDGETDPEVLEIETWLASDCAALEELFAARAAMGLGLLPEASPEILARAEALIAFPSDKVVPLRPHLRSWRTAAAWSGIAASLILSTFVGFSAGANDWLDINQSTPSGSLVQEVLDPPGTVFNNLDLDSAI